MFVAMTVMIAVVVSIRMVVVLFMGLMGFPVFRFFGVIVCARFAFFTGVRVVRLVLLMSLAVTDLFLVVVASMLLTAYCHGRPQNYKPDRK